MRGIAPLLTQRVSAPDGAVGAVRKGTCQRNAIIELHSTRFVFLPQADRDFIESDDAKNDSTVDTLAVEYIRR